MNQAKKIPAPWSCRESWRWSVRDTQTFLLAQTVKRLPTMQETQVQSLGGDDPLEKKMATHSSTLAWKIPWTEELGRLQSMGSQSRARLSDFIHTHRCTEPQNGER